MLNQKWLDRWTVDELDVNKPLPSLNDLLDDRDQLVEQLFRIVRSNEHLQSLVPSCLKVCTLLLFCSWACSLKNCVECWAGCWSQAGRLLTINSKRIKSALIRLTVFTFSFCQSRKLKKNKKQKKKEKEDNDNLSFRINKDLIRFFAFCFRRIKKSLVKCFH